MAFLSPAPVAESPAPGSYHTDGRRLLQVLHVEAESALLAIEDCRTLEVMLIPLGEVEAMGLRPVGAMLGAPEKLE